MYSIDLNSDIGESFGAYKLGDDEAILQQITAANVACGWHAGDPMVMDKVVRMASERGVVVGAHPGYPDLMGFGRRKMVLSEAVYEVDKDLIIYYCAGAVLGKVAEDMGLRTAAEIFADRAYMDDLSLVPRKMEGSMITDEDVAINRCVRMIKEGKVTSINGKDIDIKGDTLCVHGDGPKAIAFARRIRETFEKEGIEIKPM